VTIEQINPLGRPLRADAERNRRRILLAAAEVFARRGLDAGLDEIARHAGVGTGTVYRRFPDKAMLIEALFESRFDDLMALAQGGLVDPDPWAGLVGFLEGSIGMQQADRGLKELLFGEGYHSGSRHAARVAEITAAISALMDRAKDAGALRPDVAVSDLALIQFMLHGIGSFAAPVDPGQWRRQLGILLDGLRADRSAPTPLAQVPLTTDELDRLCLPPDRDVSDKD
jgi:AcrR family transcriptional regulator